MFTSFCFRLVPLKKLQVAVAYLCFNWALRHEGVLGEWKHNSTHSFTSFYLGTRRRWVVSFTPRPLYPHGKIPWYPLDRRLGGPQSRSGRGGEEKNSQPPAGNRTSNPNHPVRSQSLYRLSYPGSIKQNIDNLFPQTFLGCLVLSEVHALLNTQFRAVVVKCSDVSCTPFPWPDR
jgi:hypothetical protein